MTSRKRLRHTALFISCDDGTAGGPFDQPGHTDSLEALIYGQTDALTNHLAEPAILVTTDFYDPGSHSWP